jgi:hypothetical protein
MLNDEQIARTWQNMLDAETRALYFADLASAYTRRKQTITGITFFLASGAAATIAASAPQWVPLTMSLISAILGAYSISVGLDRKIATMAKLHGSWSRIADEYFTLWNNTADEDAPSRLDRIVQMEREPSELATTEAPNDQRRIGKWQDIVFMKHGLPLTESYGQQGRV